MTKKLFAIDPVSLAIIAAVSIRVGMCSNEQEKRDKFRAACLAKATKTSGYGLDPFTGTACLNVHGEEKKEGRVVRLQVQSGKVANRQSRTRSSEEAVGFSSAKGQMNGASRSEVRQSYEKRLLTKVQSEWSIEVGDGKNQTFEIAWTDVVLVGDLFDMQGNVEKVTMIYESTPSVFVIDNGKRVMANAVVERR